MKAFALQSTSDSAPGRKQQKAVAHPVPVSQWFPQTVSVNERPIQRKAECACGGGCPRCAGESHHSNIQTKLTVSTPGDQYEQEADRVAEQVMRMPVSQPNHPGIGFTTSSDSVVQRKCTQCTEEEELIHKKEPAGHAAFTGKARDAPPMVHEALRSHSQRLDATTRAFMEPRFGRDFSHVR